jgi:RsiW-degrading membrane proteinase PrsW (M82 family)
MLITVMCEGCKRELRTKGPIVNNTLKCTRCGHLQYVASETPARGSGVHYIPGMLGQAGNDRPANSRVDIEAILARARSATAQAPPAPGQTPVSRLVVSDIGPPPGPTPRVVTRETSSPATPPTMGDYLYWLFLLALIPLGLSVLRPKDDIKERFEHTQQAHPEAFKRWSEGEEPTLDDLLTSLPGERIEGALLPRNTWMHWAYAGLAVVGFLGLIVVMFPSKAINVKNLLLIGAFTGTVGIIMLFAVQIAAELTQGLWLRGGGIVTLIFYILKFIGYSYRSAMDPNSNFMLSFLGFTFGVGLCEELCKALPIVWYYRNFNELSWRGACRWGLASGAGFGIAEGIMYSADFYNGVHSGSIYFVRFISCVGLHSIWSASVALTLYRCQETIQGEMRLHDYFLPLLRILAVAMVFHGVYDTVLKMHLNELALATAVVSFGWLAWQIESLREEDKSALSAAETAA